DQALAAEQFDASQFDAYGEKLCAGIEIMRKIVYAFYDKNFSFGKLIKNYPDVKGDLTDCLIGDLYKGDFQELFEGMKEFAELPAMLEHGRKGAPDADRSAVPA
ncbi:MAG: alkylhalidase, partial [Verrucomicrobiota bacterium]